MLQPADYRIVTEEVSLKLECLKPLILAGLVNNLSLTTVLLDFMVKT